MIIKGNLKLLTLFRLFSIDRSHVLANIRGFKLPFFVCQKQVYNFIIGNNLFYYFCFFMKKYFLFLIILLSISNNTYAKTHCNLYKSWEGGINEKLTFTDVKDSIFSADIIYACKDNFIQEPRNWLFRPNDNTTFIESLKLIFLAWPNAEKLNNYTQVNDKDRTSKYIKMYNSEYKTNERSYKNNSFIHKDFAVYLISKQLWINFTSDDYLNFPKYNEASDINKINKDSKFAPYITFLPIRWLYNEKDKNWYSKYITRWELVSMIYKANYNKEHILQIYTTFKSSVYKNNYIFLDNNKKYNYFILSHKSNPRISDYYNLKEGRIEFFPEETKKFLYWFKQLLIEKPNIELPTFLTPITIIAADLISNPLFFLLNYDTPISKSEAFSKDNIVSKNSKIYQYFAWRIKYTDWNISADLVQEIYDILIKKRWLSSNDWKIITTESTNKFSWKIKIKKEIVYEPAKLKDWTYLFKYSNLGLGSMYWCDNINNSISIFSIYDDDEIWKLRDLHQLTCFAIQWDKNIAELIEYKNKIDAKLLDSLIDKVTY